MEDLAEKWNSLSLSEKEKIGFVLPRDQQTGDGGDVWLLVVGLSFSGRWLLALVGY